MLQRRDVESVFTNDDILTPQAKWSNHVNANAHDHGGEVTPSENPTPGSATCAAPSTAADPERPCRFRPATVQAELGPKRWLFTHKPGRVTTEETPT
jgi:hypothetical protein